MCLYCTSFFFENPSTPSPGGLPLPCLGPSCPSLQGCFGACVSQNRGLSFPFPCIVTLPVISQAPPSAQSGGCPPPSLPLSKPFLHSFYSWLGRPLPLSVPRKGMSGWSLVTDCRVGDLSPKESQCFEKLCPQSTVHSPQFTAPAVFLET